MVSGCSAAGVSEEEGFPEGDGSFTWIEPADRPTAPDLSGETLDDGNISLSDYRGTVVVLNVWGSWCAPCRHEAPELVEASTELGDTAQFIGINVRDADPAQSRAFERSFKVEYPSWYDPSGELLLELNDLPANAIPSTLVIDPEGKIAARILGETTASTLTGLVEDVVEEN